MVLSKLIVIGFLGSLFAMSRFTKCCRLLNGRDLEPEKAERFQRRARRWLLSAGVLLGMAVLSIFFGIIAL